MTVGVPLNFTIEKANFETPRCVAKQYLIDYNVEREPELNSSWIVFNNNSMEFSINPAKDEWKNIYRNY